MNVTKRNHYLPQFYLQNFVTKNDGTFWVYYKGVHDPRLQTPINTGIEKHLYNVKRKNGSVDDSVEKLLSLLESAVSPIIKKLINSGGHLEETDIPNLGLFLSFMATRIPRTIEAAREIAEAFAIYRLRELAKDPDEIDEVLEEFRKEKQIDKNITAEVLKNHIMKFEAEFKISFDKKYATGLSLNSSIDIFEQLMNMNWCLCRAPSNVYFITRDCPLVCFVLNDKGAATFGGGFGLPQAEVTFPLSPTKCLYLSRQHTQKYRAMSKTFLKKINKRTAWAAERIVISYFKNNYVENLNELASISLNLPKMDKESLIDAFRKKGFK